MFFRYQQISSAPPSDDHFRFPLEIAVLFRVFCYLGPRFTFRPDLIQLFFGQVLDADESVLRGTGADQLVELGLPQRASVTG